MKSENDTTDLLAHMAGGNSQAAPELSDFEPMRKRCCELASAV